MPHTTGHWEGDVWVEPDGYRVHNKWCDLYPDLFGPLAKDPDEGQGDVECNDMISVFLNKFSGAGGVFSTWNERHAFIISSQIGYLIIKSSDDVPPVPRFFLHESHYWREGIIIGRGAAKVEAASSQIPWTPVIVAALGAGTGGAVWGQDIVRVVLALIGVS